VSRLVVFTAAVAVWLPDVSAVPGRGTLKGLPVVRLPTKQEILPFAAVQPAADSRQQQRKLHNKHAELAC
jgi:hypothetical protein